MDLKSPAAGEKLDLARGYLVNQLASAHYGMADPSMAGDIIDLVAEALMGEMSARYDARLAALESRADAEDSYRAEQHERGD